MTDYDAIRRSPYYAKPVKERRRTGRKRGPPKPKVPTPSEKFCDLLTGTVAPYGYAVSRLPSVRKISTGLYAEVNGKRCRAYHLQRVFHPRPGSPAYARATVAREEAEPVDFHLIAIVLDGMEPEWYVLPAAVMTEFLAASTRPVRDVWQHDR